MTDDYKNNRIVIVDDDPALAEFVSDAVDFLGYTPLVVDGGRHCLEQVNKNAPVCVILDVVMPDMDGVELLSKLAASHSNAPAVIVMSGYDGKYLESVSLIGEANGLNVLGTLKKPFSVDQLEGLLAQL